MGREIGIDLGTTNTVVSYVNKYNMPVTIELYDMDESIIPSAILYESKSKVKIGRKAMNLRLHYPEACVRNFKSFFEEPRHKFKVKAVDGSEFKLTPVMVAGRFLREVISGVQDKIAEEFGDDDTMNFVDKVVISVPAKFGPTAREVVKEAAKSANLTNVELMAEPTAAAVAYMHIRPEMEGKNILVYDFGGGTFDLSLLGNDNGIFKVRYTDGDEELGGNNLTNSIISDLIRRINDDFDIDMPNSESKYREGRCAIDKPAFLTNYMKIYDICNYRIKHQLADNKKEFSEDFPVIIGKNDDGSDKVVFYSCIYTADMINELIREDIDKTISITQQAVDWADKNGYPIDRIILAGGSSQIPLIMEKLNSQIKSRLTGNITAISDDDISALISRGAALMANKNYSKENIVERTNYEIGVKQSNGALLDEFCTIIPDNEELPYTKEVDFEIPDYSSDYDLDIYQRDSKHSDGDMTVRSKSVRLKDTLHIHDIPLDRENRKIYFSFTLNEDGSLSISASIKQGDRIISQNHNIERESNLL